jgi:hypothetical protein
MLVIATFCLTAAQAPTHDAALTTHFSGSACLGPDATSAGLIADYLNLQHATDSIDAAFRMGRQIVSVPDTAVALVTDTTKCRRAITVYNHQDSVHHALSTSLYLVRSGKQYVATDPLGRAGEYTTHVVLDSTLAFKSIYYY